jgi:hypothetical protein
MPCCRVAVASGSTVALNGDRLNTLAFGGVGVVEGRIAVVRADIVASTVPPAEECVMDVEVWVEVCCPVFRRVLCSERGLVSVCLFLGFFGCSCTTRVSKSFSCPSSGQGRRHSSPLAADSHLDSEAPRICLAGKSRCSLLAAQGLALLITTGPVTRLVEVSTSPWSRCATGSRFWLLNSAAPSSRPILSSLLFPTPRPPASSEITRCGTRTVQQHGTRHLV